MQAFILALFFYQRIIMSSLLCQMAYMQGELKEMHEEIEALERNIKAIYGIKGG